MRRLTAYIPPGESARSGQSLVSTPGGCLQTDMTMLSSLDKLAMLSSLHKLAMLSSLDKLAMLSSLDKLAMLSLLDKLAMLSLLDKLAMLSSLDKLAMLSLPKKVLNIATSFLQIIYINSTSTPNNLHKTNVLNNGHFTEKKNATNCH